MDELVWCGKVNSPGFTANAAGGNTTQELAVTNNNPGNIREGKSGFKKFNSMEEGFTALQNQLNLYKTGKSAHTTGKETLLDVMKIYAPSSDNNDPESYAEHVAKMLGIKTSTPISQVDTKAWAAAIASMESPQAYKKLQSLRLV